MTHKIFLTLLLLYSTTALNLCYGNESEFNNLEDPSSFVRTPPPTPNSPPQESLTSEGNMIPHNNDYSRENGVAPQTTPPSIHDVPEESLTETRTCCGQLKEVMDLFCKALHTCLCPPPKPRELSREQRLARLEEETRQRWYLAEQASQQEQINNDRVAYWNAFADWARTDLNSQERVRNFLVECGVPLQEGLLVPQEYSERIRWDISNIINAYDRKNETHISEKITDIYHQLTSTH